MVNKRKSKVESPDISIIVPIYNAEKYLSRCIDSLLSQTKKELELILINDGSTDNSDAIIKGYNDSRIKYFKNDNNGIGKTRNFGIDNAIGKYIMFVDSDDYLDKDACKILFEKAERDTLDLVVCDFYRVENDRSYVEHLEDFESCCLKDNPQLLLCVNLAPWNKLYNTRMIKDNDIKFIEDLKYEDAPFVCKVLDRSKRIGKVNKCLNYYVIHDNSETTIRDKKCFDILKIVDIIRNYFSGKEYIIDCLDKLTVKIITNYTIQQRVQLDKRTGMLFIDKAFYYLEENVPNYKENKYYESRGFFRRTIEKSRLLTKLYCSIYPKASFSISDLIVKCFYIIMFLLFSCVIYNVIFNNHVGLIKIKPIVLIFSLIIFGSMNYLIYKFIKNKLNNLRLFRFILIIIMFILQFVFAYLFVVTPSWDFGTVYNSAIISTMQNSSIEQHDYLYYHPNNIGITLLLRIYFSVFKLFGFYHWNFLAILLNIFLIDLAIYYLYRLVKMFFSERKATYFLLVTLFYTPFITYVPIFYTDTFSMPFIISGIYYYFKFDNSHNKSLWLLLSGLMIGLGTCIKFTSIFVLIAMLIYQLIKFHRDKFLVVLKKMMIIILGFLIPYLLLQLYINCTFNSAKMERLSFPKTHYIMMGLKGIGGYDADDQDFTGKFYGISAKEKANIDVIKKRISNKIKDGSLVQFYINKIVYVWGDGSFFAPDKLKRLPNYNFRIKEYILFSKSNKNYVYQLIAQCQLMMLLLFFVLGILFRNYLDVQKRNLYLLLNIIIFGLFVFFMLWEARSRYIVNFIPVLLFTCYLGMDATLAFINKNKKYRRL